MATQTKKLFQVYNSLFLNLKYQHSFSVGYLLPILNKMGKQGLENGKNSVEIIDDFMSSNADLSEIDTIGFLFKIIQYVERQIVLFDGIEDSMSPYDLEDTKALRIEDVLKEDSLNELPVEWMQKLNDFKVKIVLTAHPTQFYRPPVLRIISRLIQEIQDNNLEEIDRLLHQLGLTSLVNSKNPTPLNEAQNIIYICRHYYYDAIADLIFDLQRKFPSFNNHELVSLGFWPCGDRDGNPNVTYETTSEVTHELRMSLMKCYYKDVKILNSKLTFKEVEEIMSELKDSLYKAMFSKEFILSYLQILEKLEVVKGILQARYESIYVEDVERLINKVQIFKNHFASLDIRQNHSVHESAVEEILLHNKRIHKSISELDKTELFELLTKEYLDLNDLRSSDPLISDTLKNMRQLNSIQRTNGVNSCHRYIVSNSEDVFSIMYLFGLLRWVNRSDELEFDLIPLFETMAGMNNCEQIMDDLFSNPVYKKHLESRNNEQTIMLGFSDGTKDGGYLKANWSIFNSKERLTAVCEKHQIKAIFFDGRGGPPARGGGKTHNFYSSLGPKIANNEIQITIQGQTITSTYGTSDKFRFNAEQLVVAGMSSFIHHENTVISAEQRRLIEELSELSYTKYVELKDHPKFLPYLEKMTTLKYYSLTHVGSRPGKRNADKKLSLSDLRAISYVGSWSQLKQNIPGYFGIGTALSVLKEQGKMTDVIELYEKVPFVKALMDNCMMSLTKCNFELTNYIKLNPEFGEFWTYLHEEYLLTKKLILEMSQLNSLMENESLGKESIKMREDIVRPLLLVQNYALQKMQTEKDEERRALYSKIIVRSMYGNINASRNSS